MKKKNLASLAFIGLSSGLLITYPLLSEDSSTDPNSENVGYHLMTEDELFSLLNAKGRALYKSLSPEGKKLALETASARCNGTNQCKGLNACRTDKNDCAGQGACQGQGKCALSDKNLAVKLVAKKMAEKREKVLPKINEN